MGILASNSSAPWKFCLENKVKQILFCVGGKENNNGKHECGQIIKEGVAGTCFPWDWF